MTFKTYAQDGTVLLDSQTPVFALTHVDKLTRLLNTPFENNKREYWYRAKRMGFNSEMRQGWANIYTKEYCMYYLDVADTKTPLTAIYYHGTSDTCEPVLFLNAGQFDGKTRLMFYSNGRLSDSELAKFDIYVFDTIIQKETQVGINLYDKDGNLTFSNKTPLLNLQPIAINISPEQLKHQDGDDLLLDEDIYNRVKSRVAKMSQRQDTFNMGDLMPSNPDNSELTQALAKLGFSPKNQGYIKPFTHKVLGFGVDKVKYLSLMVHDFIDFNYDEVKHQSFRDYERQNYAFPMMIMDCDNYTAYTSVGCQDGLYICPVNEFVGVSTSGSKDATGDDYCTYLSENELVFYYINANNFPNT